jgi:signal transduction histidine kinase
MESNPVAIAIREVLTAIRQRKRVDEILEMVLTYSSDLGHAAHGSIITIDHKARKLVITSTRGANWTLEKQMHRLSLGEGLTGHVALTGKPYLCNETRVDPNYFPLFDNVRSELVVPIIVEEKVWGLINLDGLRPDAFDEFTLSHVTLMAELAAFAIKSRIDVTEQDRMQRHLIQSEKLASLGETIAGIAHEINNPMTSILSHAQLLTLHRGGPADEASIGTIVQEAKRTADLVKNLLAFSRKESKQREVVNAHELIKQAVNLKRYCSTCSTTPSRPSPKAASPASSGSTPSARANGSSSPSPTTAAASRSMSCRTSSIPFSRPRNLAKAPASGSPSRIR